MVGDREQLGRFETGYFDAVFASNFFEHLSSPEEVAEYLIAVRRILRPSGYLIVMGPNIRVAYKEYWDFVDHRLPLSHLTMLEHLVSSGYVAVQCRARFLPYSFTGRLPTFGWLVRTYLRLRLAQYLFGRQFLIVAQPK